MTENTNKDLRLSRFEDYYIIGNNGTYFKVGLIEGSIVENLMNGLSPEDIAKKTNVNLDLVERIIAALKENCVITEEQRKRHKFNPFYIRIPLFDANRILDYILSVFFRNRIINRIYASIILFMVIGGVVLSVVRSNTYLKVESVKSETVVYLAVYIAQFITIIFHEMAHGLACNYYGGHAGKIGVALIGFNPAMFCEISSIREFKEKYKKVICCAAGLTVNASSLFLLNVADIIYPTKFNKMMILINILNIIFNLLPFIRLDGYWIFSFATGIDNLYTRSIRKAISVKDWCKDVRRENIILIIYGLVTISLLFFGLIGFTHKLIEFMIKIYKLITV